MLQKNEIARRLYEYMSERMTGMKVEEVRIGLGYVAVALDKKHTGLAAVLSAGSGISLWRSRKGGQRFPEYRFLTC